MEQAELTVALFLGLLVLVLAISFYLGRRTHTAAGYFVAGGQLHWAVNGLAFVGDYLSAASFLGICGIVAQAGFDGIVYPVGFLAGWVVALLLVAEPLRRWGRFTLTDALDAAFDSAAVRLSAALFTLILCLLYLVPQMVGLAALVTPLLGVPGYQGVMLVGIVVTIIVATAGMRSTTYVQVVKGALLLLVSLLLTLAVWQRGFLQQPPTPTAFPAQKQGLPLKQARHVAGALHVKGQQQAVPIKTVLPGWQPGALVVAGSSETPQFWYVEKAAGADSWWLQATYAALARHEEQQGWLPKPVLESPGVPLTGRFLKLPPEAKGPLGPLSFIQKFQGSEIEVWQEIVPTVEGRRYRVFVPRQRSGVQMLAPGQRFGFVEGGWASRLNFFSLMLALVLGTASLPHVLISYYTVPTRSAARKSTLVALVGMAAFYVLAFYLGLAAMTSGNLNLLDSNMAVPLLARSFGLLPFAILTAVAFATVLGTVSGLVMAASGAVAHDIMDRLLGLPVGEQQKLICGRLAAIVIGCVAIYLGVVFEGVNVSFLASWVFAVAASAYLPSLVGLFWGTGVTRQGVLASMWLGGISAMVLIMLSPPMVTRWGFEAAAAPFPLAHPAIVSLPLSALALVLGSRFTR